MRKNPNATLAGGLARTQTAHELDVAGEVIGSPERDAGRIVDADNNPAALPPSSESPTAEFVERLKNWASRMASLMPAKVSEILDLLGVKHAGRPPKPEGAQTTAERKRKQRGFEKDFDWVPFPVLAQKQYLVIETSSEDELPLFDTTRAAVISGSELRAEMAAHHTTYPQPKPSRSDVPPVHYTEGLIRFVDDTPALVLEYPDTDRVRYFIPDIRIPVTIDDVHRGMGSWSLNRGKYLTDAPHGVGELITGWGHKKGFSVASGTKSWEEPEFEDVVDGYHHDEWQYDDDESEQQDEQPKCNLCQTVIEDGYEQVIKHLEEHHPAEYQQVQRAAAERLGKQRKAEKQRERRLAARQKRCREDHDAMFKRLLEKDRRPSWYLCGTCGAPLCLGQHTKMVEEELTRRTAQLTNLSYLDHHDAIKKRPKPIYCEFCHKAIYVVDYEHYGQPVRGAKKFQQLS